VLCPADVLEACTPFEFAKATPLTAKMPAAMQMVMNMAAMKAVSCFFMIFSVVLFSTHSIQNQDDRQMKPRKLVLNMFHVET
jgi:hypothetical protein